MRAKGIGLVSGGTRKKDLYYVTVGLGYIAECPNSKIADGTERNEGTRFIESIERATPQQVIQKTDDLHPPLTQKCYQVAHFVLAWELRLLIPLLVGLLEA